jgi:hypothetical protein
MSAGWEGPNELPAMDRQESKPFGPDFKNFILSWTTVSYSILWVKFRACPAEVHLSEVGNTVSSTIPIALYEVLKSGVLKQGMKVMLAGFDVGLSRDATVLK